MSFKVFSSYNSVLVLILLVLFASPAGGSDSDKQAELDRAYKLQLDGRSLEAIAIMEKLRSSGHLSSEGEYFNLFGMYLNTTGKEAQAIAVLQDGHEKGHIPAGCKLYESLGSMFSLRDDTLNATEAFRKAAPLCATGKAYLNLAMHEFLLDNYSLAKAAARDATAKGLTALQQATAQKILSFADAPLASSPTPTPNSTLTPITKASTEEEQVSASAGKEQIYVFLLGAPAENRDVYVRIERANTFEAARERFGSRMSLLKRLDDDKCKKGYYILGMNNKDETGTGRQGGIPVAGFLNCGYKSLDDAIDHGTRDFPIPFFNVAVGSVFATSKLEEVNENIPMLLACGYDPGSREWNRPAYFGEMNYGNSSDNIAACRTLNGRYPILVDREPEQTIWVSPR